MDALKCLLVCDSGVCLHACLCVCVCVCAVVRLQVTNISSSSSLSSSLSSCDRRCVFLVRRCFAVISHPHKSDFYKCLRFTFPHILTFCRISTLCISKHFCTTAFYPQQNRKCGDALRLGSKGRYGSFHLWINVWWQVKQFDPSLTRAIPERFRDES